MVSLILFLFALAAPVQPAALNVAPSREFGGMDVSWQPTGDLEEGQVLSIYRLRPGAEPLELSIWTSIHTPPAAGIIDHDGTRCDGYELRLTEKDVLLWAISASSRCVIHLPEVRSP